MTNAEMVEIAKGLGAKAMNSGRKHLERSQAMAARLVAQEGKGHREPYVVGYDPGSGGRPHHWFTSISMTTSSQLRT